MKWWTVGQQVWKINFRVQVRHRKIYKQGAKIMNKKEMIDLLKTNPSVLNYASIGRNA